MKGKKQKGYITLLSVLIIGAVAGVISLYLLTSSLNSSRTIFTQQKTFKARAAADACVEVALQEIRDDLNYDGSESLNIADSTCSYNVIDNGSQNRTIESQGEYIDSIQRIEVEIDSIRPEINIISWQEVSDF